jgi:hypothetical protein
MWKGVLILAAVYVLAFIIALTVPPSCDKVITGYQGDPVMDSVNDHKQAVRP